MLDVFIDEDQSFCGKLSANISQATDANKEVRD